MIKSFICIKVLSVYCCFITEPVLSSFYFVRKSFVKVGLPVGESHNLLIDKYRG